MAFNKTEYMRKYNQKPEVKERRRKYEQKPEVKERKRNYYRKPEVKERRRVRIIQKLMKQHGIDEAEAIMVRKIRIQLVYTEPNIVLKMRDEIFAEEGPRFTEMVMDGIPARVEAKLSGGK